MRIAQNADSGGELVLNQENVRFKTLEFLER